MCSDWQVLDCIFVLEKWKGIGYSYNHSRTMVSQVSIADQDSLRNSLHPPGNWNFKLYNIHMKNEINFIFLKSKVTDSPHPKRLTAIPDNINEADIIKASESDCDNT